MELVRRVQKCLLKGRLLGVLVETGYEVVERRWGGRGAIAVYAKIVEMKSLKEPLAVGSKMMCLTYRQPRRWLYAYGRYSKSSGGCEVV
jgi:hypothetical protein